MLLLFLAMLNYLLLLYFGIYSAASFLDIEFSRRNHRILIIFGLFAYSLQIVCFFLNGTDYTSMIYPFITHLPLLILFIVWFKKRVLSSIFAILSSYLCCQVVKWIGILALTISGEKWVLYVTRLIITIPIWFLIIKYTSDSIVLVLSKSRKTILIFGILPAVYYLFDYVATVYTRLLYSGNEVIFEFLPFVLCIAYLLFNSVYFKEYEQKCDAERHYQLMEMQQAQYLKEVEAIRHCEYAISIIRHDMRHFLNNILSCIETGNNEKAESYIKDVIEVTEKTSLRKFCTNEVVNMVLSSYENKMKEFDITMDYTVEIPANLPCSDVEFTSILANGLENAIRAVSKLDDSKKVITLNLYMKDTKLLLSIQNPYVGKPQFKNGIPVTSEQGHGLGTQSIKYVASKLNGNCQFSAVDGIFLLRVVI